MENLTSIGVLAGSCLVGALVGWFASNSFGTRTLRRVRTEAEEIIHQAKQDAGRRLAEAELVAREDRRRSRRRADREFRDKKSTLNRSLADAKKIEVDLVESQAQLEARAGEVNTQLERTRAREAELESRKVAVEGLHQKQEGLLATISGLSREEARTMFLERIAKECRHDAAHIVRESKEEAQQTAEADAQQVMALAVERLASDFSTNRTSSTVTFSDEKLKGRLIGHEGKNIKAFEAATGMQLIVDETPKQATISGFHPIKREVARLSLEKLLKDGNIHPRRIDETVRKMTRRNNTVMRRAAEDALKELRINKVHPEMINLLGRLHFRTSYGQNVLLHSKEVAYLTGIMAAELGLDETIARRAGLFHDIGKAIDYEREGTHPEIGEEIATQFNEGPIVINAIASHHEDCEPISPISILVSAADALSGARPGARRKTLADFIRRVEALEDIATSMEGVARAYAIQAGRELRVIARPDKMSDDMSAMLATDIAKRIQEEVDYPGKIKVTVIREKWAQQVVH